MSSEEILSLSALFSTIISYPKDRDQTIKEVLLLTNKLINNKIECQCNLELIRNIIKAAIDNGLINYKELGTTSRKLDEAYLENHDRLSKLRDLDYENQQDPNVCFYSSIADPATLNEESCQNGFGYFLRDGEEYLEDSKDYVLGVVPATDVEFTSTLSHRKETMNQNQPQETQEMQTILRKQSFHN